MTRFASSSCKHVSDFAHCLLVILNFCFVGLSRPAGLCWPREAQGASQACSFSALMGHVSQSYRDAEQVLQVRLLFKASLQRAHDLDAALCIILYQELNRKVHE